MELQSSQNKRLKRYFQTGLISSSSLLLTGCLEFLDNPVHPKATVGDDVMVGDHLTNYFDGSLGADSMDGKESIDYVEYDDSPAAVQVDFSTGKGTGGHAEGDSYTSIEAVWGSAFADELTGSDEDELFIGYGGADTIDGGGGSDTIGFSGSPVGVEVNLETSVSLGGDAEGDIFSNIENIKGSSFDDILTGDAEDNRIDGEGGDDVINGGAGDDVISGVGNDVISGGEGLDTLVLNYLVSSEISNIEILKDDNKIQISAKYSEATDNYFVGQIDSIERLLLTKSGFLGTYYESVDVKNIWNDLATAEHEKFTNEADFLNWLGDDAGYNYDGI